MDREQLEFQISQYIDGTLSMTEAVALEQVLAGDAEARAMLEDFRKLNASLKRENVAPLPEIRWEKLAEHLSAAVAEEDRATTTYRISAWWTRGVAAVAALVLIAIGTAVLLNRHHMPAKIEEVATNSTPTKISDNAIAEVTGPSAEAATQPAVAEISIGPSELAKRSNYGVDEDIVYRQPRVVIATERSSLQDTSALPY